MDIKWETAVNTSWCFVKPKFRGHLAFSWKRNIRTMSKWWNSGREGLGIPHGPGVQNPEFLTWKTAEKTWSERDLKRRKFFHWVFKNFQNTIPSNSPFTRNILNLQTAKKVVTSATPYSFEGHIPTLDVRFKAQKKRERNLRSQSQNNSSVEGFLKEHTKGLCFKILGEGPQRMD